MKRTLTRTLTIIATTTLLFSGVMAQVQNNSAHANSIDSKIKDVREKKAENKKEQNAVKSSIQSIESKKAEAESSIRALNGKVSETKAEISKQEANIAKMKADIEKLKVEIDETQKRIEERDKLLKERVKAMYINGGTVSYLEVLLGAESFGNFIDRVVALSTIANNDKQILEEQKADKKKLEDSKIKVEEEKVKVEESVKALEKMQASLKAQISEKDKLIDSLNEQAEHLHGELKDIEEIGALLKSQERALVNEKKRQEEEARRRAESGQAAPTVSTGNGMFMRPISGGYVSSGMGQRWGTSHDGVDFAKGGTVPIYAAADGTVARSYRSSSYGEVIFITHYINGQQWTTVYAHMRSGSRAFGEGASVKRGQVIGIMGSTGDSTGQHLHFELHKGPWTADKRYKVNPLNYIN